MIGFLKRLFGKKEKRPPPQRRATEVAPQDFDFLTISDDPKGATAMAASSDADIRVALAMRIVELLPNLTPEKHAQVYAFAVQALMALAQDEVFKVRRALSTALRDYAKAPPSVVARLARDVEREIAEPILRYCIALADADMLDILSSHPEPWVISAIAGRPEVSEKLSEAVFDTGDVPGTAVLISNTGARISAVTLQKILASARSHPEWHGPLALRPGLTVELTQEIVGFASETILEVLRKRSDLDAPTRLGVVALVERRLAYVSEGPEVSPEEKVEKYMAEKRLTPEVVQDALAWQEREFAVLALSRLSAIPPETVRRILSSGAKPIVALCWKARLPVRMCVDVQRLAGHLQPKDLLYPKGGTEYPLTPEEISWQLEFFGVKK